MTTKDKDPLATKFNAASINESPYAVPVPEKTNVVKLPVKKPIPNEVA